MATHSTWSDEQVRAFVDGQLDAQTAARFSAQVQQDLALAERVARQRSRQRQSGTGTGTGTAAEGTRMPEGASATPAASSGTRVSAHAAYRAPSPAWWLGATGCVALAVLAGWKLPRDTNASMVSGASGLVAAGPLARALSGRISAEGSKEDGVLISLSFRAGDGRYCRTFSLLAGIDGLACRSELIWQVEATGRSPAADQAGPMRQPSSDLSASVLAAISRWQAGNALTSEEERRLRDAGWR